MMVSTLTRSSAAAGIEEKQLRVPFIDLNAHHASFLNEFTSVIRKYRSQCVCRWAVYGKVGAAAFA